MAYKVINSFTDLEDNNTLYRVGEEYPKGDYKPTQKRIEELSEVHPKQKRIFIEEVEKEDEKADREAKEAEERAAAEQNTKEESEAIAKAEEEEKNAIRTELESLGVSAHPNTGLEKLKEKLEEAKAEQSNKE
jgi:hypothetical protein